MSEKFFKNQAEYRREESEAKGELSLSHWRGSLHVHSKKDISNSKIPEEIAESREGSNCGQIPLQILTKYLAKEMLNDYVGVTEHSRDADPERALEGISKWFLEMYLQNNDWLLKTYNKRRNELSAEELTEIELMVASQAKRVACYQDERLQKINFMIENLDEPIKVFKGVEANLLPDGNFDTDMVDQNKFELVNCSIHPKVDEKNFKDIISDPALYSELTVGG